MTDLRRSAVILAVLAGGIALLVGTYLLFYYRPQPEFSARDAFWLRTERGGAVLVHGIGGVVCGVAALLLAIAPGPSARARVSWAGAALAVALTWVFGAELAPPDAIFLEEGAKRPTLELFLSHLASFGLASAFVILAAVFDLRALGRAEREAGDEVGRTGTWSRPG